MTTFNVRIIQVVTRVQTFRVAGCETEEQAEQRAIDMAHQQGEEWEKRKREAMYEVDSVTRRRHGTRRKAKEAP